MEQGQWGPRGPQPERTVRTRLRTLFRSSAVIWLARIGLVLTLIIVTQQSLAAPTGAMGFPFADKIAHFLAYAAIAGAALLSGWMRWAFAIAFATLWGAGVEVAQGVMDIGREPSAFDGLANLLGATFGAMLALGLRGSEGIRAG